MVGYVILIDCYYLDAFEEVQDAMPTSYSNSARRGRCQGIIAVLPITVHTFPSFRLGFGSVLAIA